MSSTINSSLPVPLSSTAAASPSRVAMTITMENNALLPYSTQTCKPIHRLVYIKTHKTGSTTMASILERYGYLRDLDIAVPPKSHILSNEKMFVRKMVIKLAGRKRQDFDMLVNHVRYNRTEMEIAVPNAKYVSIIRNPVAQLESAFGYFEMAKRWKIKTKNPFQTFMSDPKKYYVKKLPFWTRSRNGLLYDFGFDHKYDDNVPKIKEKIDELATEIDLIMINEYFDESLILLRKLMCWDYEDIVYLSNGIRSKSHRYTVSDDIADKIRSWSSGDVMLFDHFNRTFWDKIKEYGPGFERDLAYFRSLEQNATDECVAPDAKNTKDRRVDKLVLRENSTFCEDLLRGDVPYTGLIRKTMLKRYPNPKKKH